jgi:hypothetical protein
MTTEPKALRQGREAYQRRAHVERQRRAIVHVKAYLDWLKRGSPSREIPAVPSDAEFRIFRGQQR